MTQNNASQNLAQTEQTHLNAIEEQEKKVGAWMPTALPGNRPATLAEIDSAIDYLQRVENYYVSFGPAAQQLDAAGLHRLSQRLNQLIPDLRESRRILGETRQGGVRSQQEIYNYQRKTQQEIFNIQQQANRNQQHAFDVMNQRWSEAFNNQLPEIRYCPFCGYSLGNSSSYSFCPGCQRRL